MICIIIVHDLIAILHTIITFNMFRQIFNWKLSIALKYLHTSTVLGLNVNNNNIINNKNSKFPAHCIIAGCVFTRFLFIYWNAWVSMCSNFKTYLPPRLQGCTCRFVACVARIPHNPLRDQLCSSVSYQPVKQVSTVFYHLLLVCMRSLIERRLSCSTW